MTTNSAGFSGAKPTTMLTMPLSMSVCVVVSASHLTKNASRGVVPANAPCWKRVLRNEPTFSRIDAHSAASFGSNTTHCVPR